MTKPVKLLHTSDWHLGHDLFNHSREAEHEAFLAWLVDALEEHGVDVLLVTGDIYDVANPPVTAQQQLYRLRCPRAGADGTAADRHDRRQS